MFTLGPQAGATGVPPVLCEPPRPLQLKVLSVTRKRQYLSRYLQNQISPDQRKNDVRRPRRQRRRQLAQIPHRLEQA